MGGYRLVLHAETAMASSWTGHVVVTVSWQKYRFLIHKNQKLMAQTSLVVVAAAASLLTLFATQVATKISAHVTSTGRPKVKGEKAFVLVVNLQFNSEVPSTRSLSVQQSDMA